MWGGVRRTNNAVGEGGTSAVVWSRKNVGEKKY